MVPVAEVVVTVRVISFPTSGLADTVDLSGHPGCWHMVALIYRYYFFVHSSNAHINDVLVVGVCVLGHRVPLWLHSG